MSSNESRVFTEASDRECRKYSTSTPNTAGDEHRVKPYHTYLGRCTYLHPKISYIVLLLQIVAAV
jgi:hypothetical protein